MANISVTVSTLTQLLVDEGNIITQFDANSLWMVLAGTLVFFMHAGFAMLEAGSIHKTSVANIMFKNTATISIGVLSYWFLGFGFAYGTELDEGETSFLGNRNFLGRSGDFAFWFFQMVFAATAATIVSGAVAGRIKLSAYFIIATCLTGFVYPVVSNWIWATGGFLSAFTAPQDLFTFDNNASEVPCGTIDFAGSGVVHMTGGVAAFWGALILGPRSGWTPLGTKYAAHNYALATLGTMILWFGWYGFNAGSTLVWEGELAGHVAVTTTLAPAMAGVTGIVISRATKDKWDLGFVLNCVLGGLVSITAPCATVKPAQAIVIGLLGAFVYWGGSHVNRHVMKIDDPVDAIAVHGVCGLWGLIAVALFSDEDLIELAYGNPDGVVCDRTVGGLLQFQLLAAVIIFGWVSTFAIIIFGGLKATKQLKLTDEEQYDIDMTEHGGPAYEKM